jgi:hypothetical protein
MNTLTPASKGANFFELNPVLVALGQDQAAIVTEPAVARKPAQLTSSQLLRKGWQAKHHFEEIAWVILGLSGFVVLVLSF